MAMRRRPSLGIDCALCMEDEPLPPLKAENRRVTLAKGTRRASWFSARREVDHSAAKFTRRSSISRRSSVHQNNMQSERPSVAWVPHRGWMPGRRRASEYSGRASQSSAVSAETPEESVFEVGARVSRRRLGFLAANCSPSRRPGAAETRGDKGRFSIPVSMIVSAACRVSTARASQGGPNDATSSYSYSKARNFDILSESANVKLTKLFGEAVISVAFSSDGSLFAAGGTHKLAKLYSTDQGKEIGSFSCEETINCVLFVMQGMEEKLLLGTMSGTIHTNDVKSRSREGSHNLGQHEIVFCLAADGSGSHVAAGGKHSKVRLYRYTTIERKSALQLISEFESPGPIYALAMDRGMKVLVTGGEGKVVSVWALPVQEPPRAERNSSTSTQPPSTHALSTQARRSSSLDSASTRGRPPNLLGGRPRSPLAKAARAMTTARRFGPRPAAPPACRDGSTDVDEDCRLHRIPSAQFACKGCIYALALSEDGFTLAVGVSSHTEVYRLFPDKAVAVANFINEASDPAHPIHYASFHADESRPIIFRTSRHLNALKHRDSCLGSRCDLHENTHHNKDVLREKILRCIHHSTEPVHEPFLWCICHSTEIVYEPVLWSFVGTFATPQSLYTSPSYGSTRPPWMAASPSPPTEAGWPWAGNSSCASSA